jgi:hypothetical protein
VVDHPRLERDAVPCLPEPEHPPLLREVRQRRRADEPQVPARLDRVVVAVAGHHRHDARRRVEHRERGLAAVRGLERVVREDNHPAASRARDLAAQPGHLSGADPPARAAAPVDGVEHDAAALGAEVERVVQAAARRGADAGRARQPRDDLVRVRVTASGVGGNGLGATVCVAVREQRVDDARGILLVERRLEAGVEAGDESGPGGQLLDRAGGGHLALHEHVVVADRRVPRHAEARRTELPLRGRQRPRMARRVVVRPEVERVRVAGGLHAVVAPGAAVRAHDAALQHPDRRLELVLLRGVDDVARDHHRLGPLACQPSHGGVEHLGGERLLGPERRVERRAQAVEKRHAGG